MKILYGMGFIAQVFILINSYNLIFTEGRTILGVIGGVFGVLLILFVKSAEYFAKDEQHENSQEKRREE